MHYAPPSPLQYAKAYLSYQFRDLTSRLALKAADAFGDRMASLTNLFDNPQWANLTKFTNQSAAYATSSPVYVSVRLLSDAAALVNLNVYTLKSEKKEAVVNHPLEQLLRSPNKTQTQFEHMGATVGFLKLTGNAYWYVNGAPGQPTELLNMRPDRVRIVGGNTTDDFVKGYIYEVGGVKVPIDAVNVVHFRLFDPGSDYYGLSPLEAAALAYQTDKNMQRWNANFFGKGKAVPAGVVNVKSNIGNPQFEQVKREWMETYGGTQQATAFIRGAEVTYQDIQKSQKDMDFLSGRQFSKEEIFQIFGIYPGMLDKNATEANATAAADSFTQWTLWPLMVQIAQKISATLLPLYGDGLVCEPDDIRRKDAAAERAEIQAASSYMTINEIRGKYWNLPPRADGDLYAAGAGAAAITGQPVGFDKLPKQVDTTAIDQQEGQRQEAAQKALVTSEQRKWFFANNPTYAAQGTMPQINENAADAVNQHRFQEFVEANKHGVAKAIWDKDLVKYDNEGNLVVDKTNTKSAATALVTDARDASVSKDYLVSGSRDLYGYQGSDQQVENQINHAYSVQAQGVLMASHMGDVSLTDAQHSRLTSIAKGNYLTDKYSQYSSGERGTLDKTRQGAGTGGSRNSYESASSADLRAMRYELVNSKSLDDIIIPRVYVSRAMRTETEQFARYAAKGKPVDGFTFHNAPLGYVIAVKAMAAIPGGLDLLTFKADDKTISKWERKLQSAVSGYFDGLTTRLVSGVRHVNNPSTGKSLPDLSRFKSYFNAAFWANELGILSGVLSPLMQDAVDQYAVDAADTLTMTTGIAVDNSVFVNLASQWAKTYTDKVLQGFNTTTQDGIGALLARYIDTPDATLTDLITAIQESRLVGSDRAKLTAITENTRAQGNGEYLAGIELADTAGVKVLVSQADIDYYFPGHPYCKCRLIAEFQYDENDKLIGIDYKWLYINDSASHECEICSPRNGMLMSEIASAA